MFLNPLSSSGTTGMSLSLSAVIKVCSLRDTNLLFFPGCSAYILAGPLFIHHWLSRQCVCLASRAAVRQLSVMMEMVYNLHYPIC